MSVKSMLLADSRARTADGTSEIVEEVSGFDRVAVTLEVTAISDHAELKVDIQDAPTADGPWSNIKSFGSWRVYDGKRDMFLPDVRPLPGTGVSRAGITAPFHPYLRAKWTIPFGEITFAIYATASTSGSAE